MKQTATVRQTVSLPTSPNVTMRVLLFGDVLQLGLLLVLLGQLGEASQGGVHLLDGQEALGGRGKGFTLLEEHPNRL